MRGRCSLRAQRGQSYLRWDNKEITPSPRMYLAGHRRVESVRIAMPRGVNSPANQQQRSQRRKRRQRPAQSFEAVFEHRDAFGKPKFIGRTDSTPEARFAQDIQQHQTIRNMMTYQQGRSDVVWSGVGQYPLGPEEMSRITEKIVEERSKKLHAQKLRGPKPYSRHGY